MTDPRRASADARELLRRERDQRSRRPMPPLPENFPTMTKAQQDEAVLDQLRAANPGVQPAPPDDWPETPEPANETALPNPLADAARAKAEQPVTWKKPSAIARDLLRIGPRLPTGLPTVDRVLRGGLRQGTRVGIQGPPGAMKTMLLAWLTYGWLRAGVPVFFLAQDEDPELVMVRFGQMVGLDRDALDSDTPDPEAVERLAAEMDALPFELIGPDETALTVERVAKEARRRYPAVPIVVAVDSVQRAQCEASALADGEIAAVTAMMEALKRISLPPLRITVVSISEMNRGAFRASSGPQATDDMAAGKSSSSIEYVNRVILTLRRGKAGTVTLKVTKPTGHDDTPVSLAFDPRAATFSETETPDEPDGLADLDRDASRIVSALRQRNFSSHDAIGTAARLRKKRVGEVMAYLMNDRKSVIKNALGYYQLVSLVPEDSDGATH